MHEANVEKNVTYFTIRTISMYELGTVEKLNVIEIVFPCRNSVHCKIFLFRKP